MKTLVKTGLGLLGLAALAVVTSLVTSALLNPAVLAQGGPRAALDPPVLDCGFATQSAITLEVQAGASGAAAGFSVQYVTLDDYQAALAEGLDPWKVDSYCALSFSGVPAASSYRLGPGESTFVTLGITYDPDDPDTPVGASSDCSAPLECGTWYVIRAFAHNVPGPGNRGRSAFSQAIVCATAACEVGCTYGQGFWKNHPEAWPVDTLMLGTVTYSQAQLLSIRWCLRVIEIRKPLSSN